MYKWEEKELNLNLSNCAVKQLNLHVALDFTLEITTRAD